jgi:hypothetical protein
VDLDWVSGGLRDLRDLSLSGAELMAGSDALKDMTALTSVCIDGGLAPNDADEWTITLAGLMCIPNLRELEINGLASPVALDHLDSGPAPPLESLRMTSECDLAVESLSPLTRLTALADLSLSMYSEAPDIPGLSSLTRLTALALDAACQTFSKPSTWHVEADTSELMDVVRILPRLAYLSCTDAPFQECTSSTIRHLQVSPISLARTLERGWDLDRLPNLERLTVSAMHDLRRLELGPVIAALSRPRRTVLTLELACRKMDVSHCSTQRWMDALARVDPIGRVSVAYTVSTAK